MSKATNILKKYWGYDHFRPFQEEIINDVLKGHDVLGVLPTSAGKSICFQVPALLKEGICIVISPLVALMKDQVDRLSKINIKAIALTGGYSLKETINLLDNCEFGDYKFLYLSPERLQNDWILERIKKLKVNLVAIDEAHCVSQWGHDFRPAFLKISLLKTHFTKVPFLALTASATEQVKADIVKQLKLKETVIFQDSFARKNMAYMVFETEDKLYKIQQILTKNKQPSIVYVRNRKSCLDIAQQLQQLQIKASFYHGGLSSKEKEKNMQLWMDEEVQVIVATNAFGMGIDKSNVKTVIHIQLPENIENYYQEAGRAGRNGEKAFAILLVNQADALTAKSQFLSNLPSVDFLKMVFIKLCNYFRIAYGEGIDEKFQFNMNRFCVKYNFPILKTYNAIKFLDQQGILTFSQEFSENASFQFIISSKEIIRYNSLNPKDEIIVLTILRTYPTAFDILTPINMAAIAKKAMTTENEVAQVLEKLYNRQIIIYQSKHNDATLVFNEVRDDERTINRVAKFLKSQNELKTAQLEAMLDYATNNEVCKSNLILNYFGEKQKINCKICNYCISQKKTKIAHTTITTALLELLQNQDLDSRNIENQLHYPTKDIIFAVQNLLENEQILLLPNNKYSIKK